MVLCPNSPPLLGRESDSLFNGRPHGPLGPVVTVPQEPGWLDAFCTTNNTAAVVSSIYHALTWILSQDAKERLLITIYIRSVSTVSIFSLQLYQSKVIKAPNGAFTMEVAGDATVNITWLLFFE